MRCVISLDVCLKGFLLASSATARSWVMPKPPKECRAYIFSNDRLLAGLGTCVELKIFIVGLQWKSSNLAVDIGLSCPIVGPLHYLVLLLFRLSDSLSPLSNKTIFMSLNTVLFPITQI